MVERAILTGYVVLYLEDDVPYVLDREMFPTMFQSLLCWIGLLNVGADVREGGLDLVSILVVLDRPPQPGGTLDRLLIFLLKHQASVLRVRYPDDSSKEARP